MDIDESQQAKEMEGWVIRSAKGSDLPFIYDTWLKSYKSDSSLGKSIKAGIFFDCYRFVIDHLLSRGDTHAIVSCLPQDHDTIIGYMIARPGTIDYCFVKEAFRNWGVAGSMYDTVFPNAVGVVCTHKTFSTKEIFVNHPQLEFNPLMLFTTHKEQ